jgi:hypothetical protein
MGFWVDGLCINQGDLLKKNQQIGLMNRIYSQALSTIVWLRPSDEGSDRAIDILQYRFGYCRMPYNEDSEDHWMFQAGSIDPLPLQT